MVPPHGHWNGVMYILEYLWRTIDMDSFYSEEFKLELIGCADAKYFSDPHKTWSQTHNLFACGGTIIFWWSMKQMLLCRNKSPHKASPECVWLRQMTHHIQEMCGFSLKKNIATTMYEDWRHHRKKLSDILIRGV